MINVLHAGIYTSIQDQGRIGFAKMGVPKSGYMDAFSAEIGNRLLNNTLTDAVIEITFGGAKFEFSYKATICITGGDFSAKLNGEVIKINKVHQVEKGTVLSFGQRNYGARTYVAIQGGIQTETVLGSKSFFQGITSKVRIEKGDMLCIDKQRLPKNKGNSRLKAQEQHFTLPDLNCFPGPEFDKLNALQKKKMLKSFTISEDNNRVGYRLNEVLKNNLEPIITSSVLPGTVQLTPSGKLIVLMCDCQVTGGYPRVLQLTEYAISRLSQKITGDEVKFIIS